MDTKPVPHPGVYVYLTLDDGPLKGTDRLMQLSQDMKFPVTFMLVGRHLERNANLINQITFEDPSLISIGNHSYSHAKNDYHTFYQDPHGVLRDFNKNEALLDELLPRNTAKIARLPGRNIWQIGGRFRYLKQSGGKAAKQLSDAGYSLIGWDVEWQKNPKTGAPHQSVVQVVDEIDAIRETAFTPGHVVILAHDIMFQNPIYLQELVELLRQKGYALRNMSTYPGLEKTVAVEVAEQ